MVPSQDMSDYHMYFEYLRRTNEEFQTPLPITDREKALLKMHALERACYCSNLIL